MKEAEADLDAVSESPGEVIAHVMPAISAITARAATTIIAVRLPLPEELVFVPVSGFCRGEEDSFESEYGVESDEPQEFLSFKGNAPLCAVQREKCERKGND